MIIVVGHEKGGVGKSTIAINLAALIAADEAKPSVVLVDTDRSGNTSAWFELRRHNGLDLDYIVMNQAVESNANIVKLSERHDVVIVDIGAADYKRLDKLAFIADLWVSPTGVGQKEMDGNVNLIQAFEESHHRHKNGRIPYVIVYNRVPSAKNSKEASLAIEAVRGFNPDVVVLDNVLCERKVFRDADKEGKTIFEMPAKAADKAVEEFTNIYADLLAAHKKFLKGAKRGN